MDFLPGCLLLFASISSSRKVMEIHVCEAGICANSEVVVVIMKITAAAKESNNILFCSVLFCLSATAAAAKEADALKKCCD